MSLHSRRKTEFYDLTSITLIILHLQLLPTTACKYKWLHPMTSQILQVCSVYWLKMIYPQSRCWQSN